MKKLILIAMTIAATKAVAACPNLVGQWVCGDPGATSNVAITQSAIVNGIHYALTDSSGVTDWYVDGTKHAFDNGDFQGTVSGQCSDDGKSFATVTDVATADGTVKIYETQNNVLDGDKLTVTRNTTSTIQDQEPSTTNLNFSCVKK